MTDGHTRQSGDVQERAVGRSEAIEWVPQRRGQPTTHRDSQRGCCLLASPEARVITWASPDNQAGWLLKPALPRHQELAATSRSAAAPPSTTPSATVASSTTSSGVHVCAGINDLWQRLDVHVKALLRGPQGGGGRGRARGKCVRRRRGEDGGSASGLEMEREARAAEQALGQLSRCCKDEREEVTTTNRFKHATSHSPPV